MRLFTSLSLHIFIAGLFIFHSFSSLQSAEVKIKKSSQGWMLLVDGKPYDVKGVGANTATGPNGEDYLKMAKEMGANSVRTWGVRPKSYFDSAEKYGLTVLAGVWFNAISDDSKESYRDPEHRKRLKKETLDYVRKMKNHPALLFWNFGNETFLFSKKRKERKAFGLFLEDLIQAVHKEDPSHPIVFAAASPVDLEHLKKYVPSVDIIGANNYGGFSFIPRWLDKNNMDKPILATEYGPFGGWDRMKDDNNLPYDPYDQYKAHNYKNMWREINSHKERVLGGYAFVLGNQRNQDSLTWYNMNYRELKRAGYWAVYTLYTGKKPPNLPPKIRLLRVDKISNLKPGEKINLEVLVTDPDSDKLTIEYFITEIANDPLRVDAPIFHPTNTVIKGKTKAQVQVPNKPGVYRVYAMVKDGKGNVAIGNRSLHVKN